MPSKLLPQAAAPLLQQQIQRCIHLRPPTRNPLHPILGAFPPPSKSHSSKQPCLTSKQSGSTLFLSFPFRGFHSSTLPRPCQNNTESATLQAFRLFLQSQPSSNYLPLPASFQEVMQKEGELPLTSKGSFSILKKLDSFSPFLGEALKILSLTLQ